VTSFGGQAVTRADIHIPAWGVWWIDCETVGGGDLTGAQTFEADGATLAGTVVHGSEYAGRGVYRVAGGAGGWGSLVAEQGYSNDAGVKASTVIGDVARLAGETLGTVAADRLGSHWTRPSAAASTALNLIYPRGWYVDDDGVTQIGQRPSVTYTGDATVSSSSPDARSITLAVDSLAQLRPGVVYDGGEPAQDVLVRITARSVRATLLRDASTSARTEAMRQVVLALFPSLRYSGVYEYRVTSQEGERLHLQSVRASSGMPDLARVPVRMTTGVRANHTPGSLVLVAFIGNDPARPCVIAGDDSSSAGWQPILLELGTGAIAATRAAARFGDTVQAGPWPGTITSGSATTAIGG
jgi:hypothetical protein